MKHDEPRRPGRPRTLDREKALRTAMELFWRHGYEGTSVSDLTMALGITPPSLYAAFGSKEGLYREALDLYVREEGGFGARALREEKTAFDAIRRLFREAVELYSSGERGCMLVGALATCAEEHEAMRREAASIRLAMIGLLTERLTRAVREGELPGGTDVSGLAAFVAAVIQGIAVQARDGVPASILTSIAQAALAAWPGRRE